MGPPPQCTKCGNCRPHIRTVPSTNRNGNGGRQYWACTPWATENPSGGGYFICWNYGYLMDATNPECECGMKSRKEVSRRNTRQPGQVFYRCAAGRCKFMEWESDLEMGGREISKNLEMGGREIPKIAKDCQTAIASLLAAAKDHDSQVKDFVNERDVGQIQERFDQWAGNLGALQPSESPRSLEYRLRNSSVVKVAILKTLVDFYDSVQSATEITAGRRNNRIAGPIIDSETDLAEYGISSSDSDSEISSASSFGNAIRATTTTTSEIQELMLAIKLGLDNLFKASIFIQKFAPKDRRQRASHTKPFDNRTDAMYIRDRYPLVTKKNAALVERLGEANARRRQYFKYRRDHDERLSRPDTRMGTANLLVLKSEPWPVNQSSKPAKSATSEETKPSLLADTEATEFMTNSIAEAQLSASLDALPAPSVVSYATSIVESSEDTLSFPPLPAEAENNSSFLCPYCLTVVPLKLGDKDSQWRNHVLKDLEPYVCTFPQCSLDTYQSQHAWFEHELLVHRNNWVCPRCPGAFKSADALGRHINTHHSQEISNKQLPTVIEQSKRPIENIQPSECPFCDDKWASTELDITSAEEVLVVELDQFRRHLGHHLQQVSLFSLPRLIYGPEIDSNQFGGLPDRDVVPASYMWVRGDCGRGWSIISGRRGTFIAFAFFLDKCRTGSPSTPFLMVGLESELSWDTEVQPPQLKGGTLDALVERLTHNDKLDSSFNSTFLLTYQSFTNARELFELLAGRFNIRPPKWLIDPREYRLWRDKKQKLIRFRVVNILENWFDTFWMEENNEESKDLIRDVYNFAEDVMKSTETPGVTSLMAVLDRRLKGEELVSRSAVLNTLGDAPLPILPKNMKKLKFLDIDAIEFARQLTIIESRLYAKIKPTECLNKAWQKEVDENDPEPAPNLKAFILHSNQITNWVAEMILAQMEVKQRVVIIKHFVAIAEKCQLLNNFSTLTSMISGLGVAPTARLKRTWDQVPARTRNTLEDMRRLMASTRNFGEYRKTLHTVNPPCIPFVGVCLADLAFIEDDIPSIIQKTNHINFAKRAKTAEVIRDIQQYQATPYSLHQITELEDYILSNIQAAGDVHEMYDRSLQIEPREPKDEKINRLLSESGFL